MVFWKWIQWWLGFIVKRWARGERTTIYSPPNAAESIRCKSRLSGLLKYYHRAA